MACQQKPHCKQGTWRAGIYFPFKKVLRRELNKCRPFYLWLLRFLENNPNSELFKAFMFLPTLSPPTFITILLLFPSMAKLDNCVLSLFACTTLQDGKPGLTRYTGLSELACGHLNTQTTVICSNEETKPPSFINCHGNQVPSMKQAWIILNSEACTAKSGLCKTIF